jgi:hypothetical protein
MALIEMDCYDYDSYQISLDNLGMLKIFHENGIDISDFPPYMSSVHHGCPESTDIFVTGVQKLFQCVHYDDFTDSKLKELVDDSSYEFLLIFQDECFKKVLNSPFSEKFLTLFKKVQNRADHAEFVLSPLKDLSGISLDLLFGMELLAVVEGLLELRVKAQEFVLEWEATNSDTGSENRYR